MSEEFQNALSEAYKIFIPPSQSFQEGGEVGEVTTPEEEETEDTLTAFNPLEKRHSPVIGEVGRLAGGYQPVIDSQGNILTDPTTGQPIKKDLGSATIDPVLKQVQEEEVISGPTIAEGTRLDPKGISITADKTTIPTGVSTAALDKDITQIKKEDLASLYAGVTGEEAEAATLGQPTKVLDPIADQYLDERTASQLKDRGILIEGAEEDLKQEATVQYQFAKLTEGLETGNIPAWASPTIRKINAVMQQRGLGASSMAASALVQGLKEAGMSIAQADAAMHAKLQFDNLNRRQQALLSNAANLMTIDQKDLDRRMMTAQKNAEMFLTTDLTDIKNEQQTSLFNTQARIQALTTDVAAENVATQINAKTQNEVDQFYNNLEVTTELTNNKLEASLNQFDTQQSNAMKTFVAGTEDERETFNAANTLQIDQSNVLWRRNTNTANTAMINETNRQNAQNLLAITESNINRLWQLFRDESNFVYNAGENSQSRAHALAILGLQQQFSADMFGAKLEFNAAQATSKAVTDALVPYASSGLSWLFGKLFS